MSEVKQHRASGFSEGIAEIVLVVEDLGVATRFYEDVVGLTRDLGDTEEGWAWFWTGKPGGSARLALRAGRLLFEEHSPRPDGDRWGRIHYAFEVPRGRLEEAAGHVRSEGVEVYGPVRLEWMNADSYYFYDPDGNLLEWWSRGRG